MNHLFLVLGLAGLLVMAGRPQANDFQYNKMGVWLLGGGTQLRKGFVTNSDDPNGNLSTIGPTVKLGTTTGPSRFWAWAST